MGNKSFTPLRYFKNEEVELVEVKLDSPKINQWLKINSNTNEVKTLSLQNSTEEVIGGNNINIRTFKNSELRFEGGFAKFIDDKNGHLLIHTPLDQIPTDILQSFFNQ